jgi:hypothetical protein
VEREENHLRPSNQRALLRVLAWGSMLFAGCVSLNLPPERADSGAGGSHADVKPSADLPASGGNSGGDSDAPLAPDVPAVAPGSGGIDIPGSGGHFPAGTGGLALAAGGTSGTVSAAGGAGGEPLDVGACDTAGDAYGIGAGGAGSGGATGGGGNGGANADAPTDAVDAPPGDVPSDAPVTAPTAGLVVYWPCEGADGNNLQDRSGSGNNGQIITASSGGFRFESGKIGNGLTLSQAQSAYISLGAQPFKGTHALTIATWIKPGNLTTWQRLFDIGVNANLSQNAGTGTAYFSLVLKDLNGKIGLTSTKDGYSSSKILNADGLPSGVWKHIAIVASDGGATIYIDGSSVATTATLLPPGALGNIDYAFIGKSQFSVDPLIDAELDEFRVYNRALSADEIRALFEYAGP